MEKGKRAIIKLLIIITSFFFVDGGRSFLTLSDNIQILLTKNHTNDIEIPHQHPSVSFQDEEKWLESFTFNFSCSCRETAGFLSAIKFVQQEFLDSVWQPPKSA